MSFTAKDLIGLMESATPDEIKTIKSLLSIDEKKTKASRKPRTSKSKATGQPFDPSMCFARCYAVQDPEKFGKDGDKKEKNNHIGLIDFQCTGKTINGTHYCYRHGGKGEPAKKNICQESGKLFLGDYGKLDDDGNPVTLPRPENPTRLSSSGKTHKYLFLDSMDADLEKGSQEEEEEQEKNLKSEKGKKKKEKSSPAKDKPITFEDIEWEKIIVSGDINDLPQKTLKLYLDKFDISTKGLAKKSDKVKKIIEHFDLNKEQEDSEENQEEEEEEVETDVEEEEEEEQEEAEEEEQEEEEEEDEEEEEEEEEEVEMPVEEIQGVEYAIHEGNAIDIETDTVMGPVGDPVASTDVSKWGENVPLHLKNLTAKMNSK